MEYIRILNYSLNSINTVCKVKLLETYACYLYKAKLAVIYEVWTKICSFAFGICSLSDFVDDMAQSLIKMNDFFARLLWNIIVFSDM